MNFTSSEFISNISLQINLKITIKLSISQLSFLTTVSHLYWCYVELSVILFPVVSSLKVSQTYFPATLTIPQYYTYTVVFICLLKGFVEQPSLLWALWQSSECTPYIQCQRGWIYHSPCGKSKGAALCSPKVQCCECSEKRHHVRLDLREVSPGRQHANGQSHHEMPMLAALSFAR